MNNEIMGWAKCEREFIRKVEIDKERISSIVKKALRRVERGRKENKEIDFAVEDYYESIKELLVAYLLKHGMRSKNHQCLISYFLKENPDFEKEAILIQQMSFFRNRLEYYGEDIPADFFEKNKEDFEKIIKLILELIE